MRVPSRRNTSRRAQSRTCTRPRPLPVAVPCPSAGSRAAGTTLSEVRTFGRLLGFLRPYRRGVVLSLILATAAMAATVAIPALTGRAIDQIDQGDDGRPEAPRRRGAGRRHPAAGAHDDPPARRRPRLARRRARPARRDVRAPAVARARRSSTASRPGQLMSRATVDLQSVRFFLGYGLVFIIQSALTIVLSAVAMFIVNPPLAAIALAPVPFVVFVAARYGRRSRPALQEVQQRIAELTAEVEENVSRRARRQGVRRRGAPARGASSASRAASSTSRWSRRGCGPSTPRSSGFLPQLGLAAVLLRRRPPGHQRHDHARRVHAPSTPTC